ncbi:MAG: ABC transporter permease [Bacteroidales bacterium]|nr:ABC transporter permease [Bacteroidales bacterium]
MKSMGVTLWAESLKVRKSIVFWLSMVFFVFISFMMGLFMLIQQHPEISQKLGLIGTKASMLRFGEPSWKNYFTLLLQGIGAIGLIGFGFITSWMFGREYSENTLKDIIALPVSRSSIVISKLLVAALWSILLAGIFVIFSTIFGYLSGISGWSGEVFSQFLYKCTLATLLTILLCTTTSFFASMSGGVLLPIGIIIITLMMANFSGLLGLGPYFPWAIPELVCSPPGTEDIQVGIASYIILFSTSILGLFGTLAWWRFADQK